MAWNQNQAHVAHMTRSAGWLKAIYMVAVMLLDNSGFSFANAINISNGKNSQLEYATLMNILVLSIYSGINFIKSGHGGSQRQERT